MIPENGSEYYKVISRMTVPPKKVSGLKKILMVAGVVVSASGLVSCVAETRSVVARKTAFFYDYFGMSYK